MSAPGLVSPDSFPIRDPKDKGQQTGRIMNPPRYAEFGGLAGPDIWHKRGGTPGNLQEGEEVRIRVEKPTSLSSAHRSSREDD